MEGKSTQELVDILLHRELIRLVSRESVSELVVDPGVQGSERTHILDHTTGIETLRRLKKDLSPTQTVTKPVAIYGLSSIIGNHDDI